MRNASRLAVPGALALIVATAAVAGGVKIRTNYDKQFNFATTTTYAWHPTGAGDVKLLVVGPRTAEDYRRVLEPAIVQYVDEVMQQRGIAKVAAPEAALHVNYYVLLGIGTSSQEMGQFIPAVPQWGVQPFAPQTTSIEAYPSGSLVLDIASREQGAVVWRGTADAELDRTASEAERRTRLRKAIADLLKKFPPKK